MVEYRSLQGDVTTVQDESKFWSSEKEGRKFYGVVSVKQQFSTNGRHVV